MSASVILINAFTVPVQESDRFLERWRDNARVMSGRPGFRRARMHRARHDDAELRFVNVAEWDSEDAWREAQASPEFRASAQRLLADPELHVTARPAIYDVVVDVPAGRT
jgi:heme-degrading monooxygenase HmoA